VRKVDFTANSAKNPEGRNKATEERAERWGWQKYGRTTAEYLEYAEKAKTRTRELRLRLGLRGRGRDAAVYREGSGGVDADGVGESA
jgi:hypothetical protein